MGKFTASAFAKLFMGEKTAGYRDTIYGAVHERLTGNSPDRFYGEWMRRGHELEPYIIEEYEIDTFNEVHNGGFWTLGEWLGASPDGLVEPNGLIEGKAPKYTTFMDYMLCTETNEAYPSFFSG